MSYRIGTYSGSLGPIEFRYVMGIRGQFKDRHGQDQFQDQCRLRISFRVGMVSGLASGPVWVGNQFQHPDECGIRVVSGSVWVQDQSQDC